LKVPKQGITRIRILHPMDFIIGLKTSVGELLMDNLIAMKITLNQKIQSSLGMAVIFQLIHQKTNKEKTIQLFLENVYQIQK